MARLVAAVLCLASLAASEDSLFGHDTEALLQSKRAKRSHVSVEVWNRMMDNIMTQVGTKAYSEVTPAVVAGIEKMINLIDGIEAYLRSAFIARQTEITDYEGKIKEGDAKCKHEKYQASTYGEALQKCAVGQHEEREALVDCISEKGKLWSACDAACDGSYKGRIYQWTVPYESIGWQHCDVTDWSTCDRVGCSAYSDLTDFVRETGDKIDRAYTDFQGGNAHCLSMKYGYEKQSSKCNKYKESWNGWGKECRTDYDNTRFSVCTFGGYMQGKCIEIVHMNKTRTLLWDPQDESAGKEWAAIDTIRCLLKSYKKGGSFDMDTKEKCEYNVDQEGIKGVHYEHKELDYPCVELSYKFVQELNGQIGSEGSLGHLLIARVLTNALANGDQTPFGSVFSFCGEPENDHRCPYSIPADYESCEHEYLVCNYKNANCCPGESREPTVIATCSDGKWDVEHITLDCTDDCEEPPYDPTPSPTYTIPTPHPTQSPYTYPPTPSPTPPYTTTTTTPYEETTTTTPPYEPTPTPTSYTTTTPYVTTTTPYVTTTTPYVTTTTTTPYVTTTTTTPYVTTTTTTPYVTTTTETYTTTTTYNPPTTTTEYTTTYSKQ